MRDVREAHRFDEKSLETYLALHLDGFRAPLSIKQFKGGQSNPTYLLEAGSGRYVLRRKPPGKLLKSAHAVDREFRIISALRATGFPVPTPYLLCEDDEVIGTTFFVMEFVEGRIFWDLDLPDLDATERKAIYADVNDTIAALHNLDFAAIGLQDYGKSGNYFSRQISRWTGQYRASEIDVVDAMDGIGTTFFVMEFVEGRIFWDLDLPDLDATERKAIYADVNDTIAALHNLDFAAIGLQDYGKSGNYFSRQISRWTGQYRASEIDVVDAMDALIRWLPENIPDDESVSIVHGDYRLDNIILHPTEPRVLAVLDWELSTIGHPLADFTYHLMTWQMPEIGIGSRGLLGKPLAELGIPDEVAHIERYCQKTGRNGGIPDRNFYSAFNFFRLAAILQGIAGRVRDGTAASAHAQLAVKSVRPLAEIGLKYMDET